MITCILLVLYMKSLSGSVPQGFKVGAARQLVNLPYSRVLLTTEMAEKDPRSRGTDISCICEHLTHSRRLHRAVHKRSSYSVTKSRFNPNARVQSHPLHPQAHPHSYNLRRLYSLGADSIS